MRLRLAISIPLLFLYACGGSGETAGSVENEKPTSTTSIPGATVVSTEKEVDSASEAGATSDIVITPDADSSFDADFTHHIKSAPDEASSPRVGLTPEIEPAPEIDTTSEADLSSSAEVTSESESSSDDISSQPHNAEAPDYTPVSDLIPSKTISFNDLANVGFSTDSPADSWFAAEASVLPVSSVVKEPVLVAGVTPQFPPQPGSCIHSYTQHNVKEAVLVGDGTKESCTNAALQAALDGNQAIDALDSAEVEEIPDPIVVKVAFNCGNEPVVIPIQKTLEIKRGYWGIRTYVIDGGGKVTLDADPDKMADSDVLMRRRHIVASPIEGKTNVKLVLQNISLINGRAPLTPYYPQLKEYPKCAYGWGVKSGGGSIYLKNGSVHVYNSTFRNNRAALLGPDVGGGAIYTQGSREGVVVIDSRFENNVASNGGAIASLGSFVQSYNSQFISNYATGTGQNARDNAACPGEDTGLVYTPNGNIISGVTTEEGDYDHLFTYTLTHRAFVLENGDTPEGHDHQIGAGGLGGAIYNDGYSATKPNPSNSSESIITDPPFTFCGTLFYNNKANELGGGIFRTPNNGLSSTHIERSYFLENSGGHTGAAYLQEQRITVRDSSFIRNRSAILYNGLPYEAEYEEFGGIEVIYMYAGWLDMQNSTVVGWPESAPEYNLESKLMDLSGVAQIRNSTFVFGAFGGGAHQTVDGVEQRKNHEFAVEDGTGGIWDLQEIGIYNSFFYNTFCYGAAEGKGNKQYPDPGAIDAVELRCADQKDNEASLFVSTNPVGVDQNINYELQNNGYFAPTIKIANPNVLSDSADACPNTDQLGVHRGNDSCSAGAQEF